MTRFTFTKTTTARPTRSSRLAAFARAEQGLAALEFALVVPLLVMALVGFSEIDRYAATTRQLESSANAISQMLTQSTSVTNGDLNFAYDSLTVLFPRVLDDSARKGARWRDDISVAMSSVAFAKTNPACATNCAYTAQVAWSGGSAKRPCATPLKSAPNASRPSSTELPADAFGPNALVAVDLEFTYAPLFAAKLFGPVTIKRSGFMQARYTPTNSYVKYAVAGGDSLVTTCPGY
jgi:Flp pilus assembly protein TadG